MNIQDGPYGKIADLRINYDEGFTNLGYKGVFDAERLTIMVGVKSIVFCSRDKGTGNIASVSIPRTYLDEIIDFLQKAKDL